MVDNISTHFSKNTSVSSCLVFCSALRTYSIYLSFSLDKSLWYQIRTLSNLCFIMSIKWREKKKIAKNSFPPFDFESYPISSESLTKLYKDAVFNSFLNIKSKSKWFLKLNSSQDDFKVQFQIFNQGLNQNIFKSNFSKATKCLFKSYKTPK